MMQQPHVHTPRRDSQGRDICTVCSAVVITPILSEDDPRLQGAGLHRSGGAETPQEILDTLPDMLIAMHFQIGAPVSWYVDAIASKFGHENIWDVLYGEWYYQWTHKIT